MSAAFNSRRNSAKALLLHLHKNKSPVWGDYYFCGDGEN